MTRKLTLENLGRSRRGKRGGGILGSASSRRGRRGPMEKLGSTRGRRGRKGLEADWANPFGGKKRGRSGGRFGGLLKTFAFGSWINPVEHLSSEEDARDEAYGRKRKGRSFLDFMVSQFMGQDQQDRADERAALDQATDEVQILNGPMAAPANNSILSRLTDLLRRASGKK